MDDYFIMVDFPNYRSLWILLFYEAVGLLLLFKEHPVCLYPSQKNPQKQNKTKTPPKKPWDSLMSFFLKNCHSCWGLFWEICQFVHCFVWGNNSCSTPGGARHTADGQPGSYKEGKKQGTELEELRASPTMWQLEYILKAE